MVRDDDSVRARRRDEPSFRRNAILGGERDVLVFQSCFVRPVQDRRAELAEAVSNALQDLFDLLQQSSRLTGAVRLVSCRGHEVVCFVVSSFGPVRPVYDGNVMRHPTPCIRIDDDSDHVSRFSLDGST